MIHVALVTLLLTPWKGPSFPTASAAAAKYRLLVHGGAKQSVDLRATGLPNGWVASFCTPKFCSPFSYTMQLDRHGSGTIEFQLIRVDDNARRHVNVFVESPGARSASLSI